MRELPEKTLPAATLVPMGEGPGECPRQFQSAHTFINSARWYGSPFAQKEVWLDVRGLRGASEGKLREFYRRTHGGRDFPATSRDERKGLELACMTGDPWVQKLRPHLPSLPPLPRHKGKRYP